MKLFLFIILLSPLVFFSQSQKQFIKYADEDAKFGDFYGASLYYKKALKLDLELEDWFFILKASQGHNVP